MMKVTLNTLREVCPTPQWHAQNPKCDFFCIFICFWVCWVWALLGALSPSGCPEPLWVPCALLGSLCPVQNVTVSACLHASGLVRWALLGSLCPSGFLVPFWFVWCSVSTGVFLALLTCFAWFCNVFNVLGLVQCFNWCFCVDAVFQLVCFWPCWPVLLSDKWLVTSD